MGRGEREGARSSQQQSPRNTRAGGEIELLTAGVLQLGVPERAAGGMRVAGGHHTHTSGPGHVGERRGRRRATRAQPRRHHSRTESKLDQRVARSRLHQHGAGCRLEVQAPTTALRARTTTTTHVAAAGSRHGRDPKQRAPCRAGDLA